MFDILITKDSQDYDTIHYIVHYFKKNSSGYSLVQSIFEKPYLVMDHHQIIPSKMKLAGFIQMKSENIALVLNEDRTPLAKLSSPKKQDYILRLQNNKSFFQYQVTGNSVICWQHYCIYQEQNELIWMVSSDNSPIFNYLNVEKLAKLRDIQLDMISSIGSREIYTDLCEIDRYLEFLKSFGLERFVCFKLVGNDFVPHNIYHDINPSNLNEFMNLLPIDLIIGISSQQSLKSIIHLDLVLIDDLENKIQFDKLHESFNLLHPILLDNELEGFVALKFADSTNIHPSINEEILCVSYLLFLMKNKIEMVKKMRTDDVLYKTTLDMTADAIALHSNGILKYVNNAALNMFKASHPDELVGRPIIDFVHEESLPIVRERIRKMAQGHDIKQWQVEKMIANDKSILNVRTAAKPLIIGDEQYFMVVVRDISDQISLEKKAYLSEQKYQTLIEASPDPIIILRERKIVFANLKTLEFFNFQEMHQLLNSDFIDYIADHGEDAAIRWMNKPAEEKYGKFITIPVVIDNITYDMEVSTSPIIFENENADLVILRDRTELNRAAKQIRENETKYRSIFENSSDAIFITDKTYITTNVNKSFLNLFDIDENDINNQSIFNLFKNKTDIQIIKEEISEFGHTDNIEIEFLTPDQRTVIGQLTMNTRKDTNNQIIETQGLIRDITYKKLNDQSILTSQKLESLGILAGGIAHDFNNLLSGLVGASSLLSKKLFTDDEVLSLVNIINKTSNRATELVNQLLAYAGEAKIKKETTNLSKVIREMQQLIKLSIKPNIELHYTLKDIFSKVEIDRVQIGQIILNLVQNAVDALEEVKDLRKGSIQIQTKVEMIEDQYINNVIDSYPIKPGMYSCITIRDNGSGIERKDYSRIFDPFYTTKFTGRGLGLAAVMGLVKAHKGAIEINSEVGIFTQFTVYFPIKIMSESDETEDTVEIQSKLVPITEKKTILVVDDEEIVLETVQRLLKALGYEVKVAENGFTGIELVKHEDIDLVLLDLTMPYLNGYQTYVKIKEIRAELPVIISSGYSEKDSREQFKDLKIDGFLHKPYTVDDLKRILTKYVK
ncbi:MAG: PAS domain-containing protein [Candidatus Heimdallarchaeota archaeon]|nr:PAS domain-containing protein [Candidatus Heimdallarchaeota archaeon]